MPKSVSFAAPSSATMTLPGLTSRWMTPRACACSSAAHSVDADPDDVEVRQRAVALEVAERPPAHELGDQPPRLLVVAGLVERDDRRVREPRGGERLALGARVLAALERDALDRDGAVQALVVGEPDHAEAAAAEAPDQAVAVEDERLLAVRSAPASRAAAPRFAVRHLPPCVPAGRVQGSRR